MANPVIRIRNANNQLQFTNSAVQYQFIGKGVAYTTKASQYRIGNTTPSTVLIPIPANRPDLLIAVRAPFLVARWITMVDPADGQTKAMYACQMATENQPVEYWIFDLASNLDTPVVGLKLRNPDTGQVIYNSDYDSMRLNITNVYELPVTYTAGKKYAVAAPIIAGVNETTGMLYVDGEPYPDGEGDNMVGRHRYQRQNYGKLTGLYFKDETLYQGQVSFDDVVVEAPGIANQPDPPRTWWEIELPNVLVMDVSAF